MQRIDILPEAATAASVELVDVFGEVHVRDMPQPAAEALRRWASVLRLLDRVTAEALGQCGAANGRGQAAGDSKGRSVRSREHPIDMMWRKRQISDRAWLAGRAVDTLLSQGQALEGLGSTLKTEGMITSGGAGDARQLALMQVTQRWARVTSAILADPACGSVPEHRRVTIQIVEMVCHHGMTITEIEQAGGLGRRAVLARRLKAGLDMAARALMIRGSPEGNIRTAHFETSADEDAEGEESEAA